MKTIAMMFLLVIATMPRQEKMLTKTGRVTFEASVPAFEEVKAVSETVTCVLNPKTGDLKARC